MAARNKNPIKIASQVVGLSFPALKMFTTDVRAIAAFQHMGERIIRVYFRIAAGARAIRTTDLRRLTANNERLSGLNQQFLRMALDVFS